MEGIRHLIIDFGGVIINLTRNRCIEAFEQLGVDVRDKLINNHQHKDFFRQLEMGTISPADFRNVIRQLTTKEITDDDIDNAWIAMLDEVPEWKLDLLLNIRDHYNTVLLSNTNLIHWEWARQNVFSYKDHQVEDFFTKTYFSFELHMEKPDIEIFEYVLNDAAINPLETLFIDDALVNCKAAESLGIRSYMPDPREDWSFLFL